MNEELKKHQEEISIKRRSFAQARAIIQRGREAGIPDRYIRVKLKDLQENICDRYHSNSDLVASQIYKNPNFLFDKPYIVIDGGDPDSRKLVGCAILFRMIACDRRGLLYDCGQLASEFSTFNYNGEDRNSLVKRVKSQDILFLSEFHKRKFNINLPDSANFFDQLLGYRNDYKKPTIITFSNPLESRTTNMGNAIKDDRCGIYLSMISHADLKGNDKFLRIRVK
jgi:hypothetical protein